MRRSFGLFFDRCFQNTLALQGKWVAHGDSASHGAWARRVGLCQKIRTFRNCIRFAKCPPTGWCWGYALPHCWLSYECSGHGSARAIHASCRSKSYMASSMEGREPAETLRRECGRKPYSRSGLRRFLSVFAHELIRTIPAVTRTKEQPDGHEKNTDRTHSEDGRLPP